MMRLYFLLLLISYLQPLMTVSPHSRAYISHMESEFHSYYKDVAIIRWPALDRMSRKDLAKLCVKIYKMHTLINLGDFKTPVTASMATYMGKHIKYQTINERPTWIMTLRCGVDNMVFTKYRGPTPDPFLAFGGIDDDHAYILEERLDGYVYLVTKVNSLRERRRRNCFRCRTTRKYNWYSALDEESETEQDHATTQNIDESMMEAVQWKNSSQEMKPLLYKLAAT